MLLNKYFVLKRLKTFYFIMDILLNGNEYVEKKCHYYYHIALVVTSDFVIAIFTKNIHCLQINCN